MLWLLLLLSWQVLKKHFRFPLSLLDTLITSPRFSIQNHPDWAKSPRSLWNLISFPNCAKVGSVDLIKASPSDLQRWANPRFFNAWKNSFKTWEAGLWWSHHLFQFLSQKQCISVPTPIDSQQTQGCLFCAHKITYAIPDPRNAKFLCSGIVINCYGYLSSQAPKGSSNFVMCPAKSRRTKSQKLATSGRKA